VFMPHACAYTSVYFASASVHVCAPDYIIEGLAGASPSFGTTPRRSSKDTARVCTRAPLRGSLIDDGSPIEGDADSRICCRRMLC